MSEKASKSPMVGLFVLLAKVGGKLAKVFPKLLKALKLGKTGMAAGSFAAYAVLFSWQFAVVLMGSLFFHEMGHIWAMKKSGMKTKGVYFIPLLGAAAVSEGSFPTRKSEVFIALMGPLWGFGLAVLTFGVYLLTGQVLFAALAGWMAMLNLFNLLPINPLDGGRVMKSVAYSISNRAGLWFMLLGLAGAFALAWVFNMGLITFLIILGALELIYEIDTMRKDDDRRKIAAALAGKLGCDAAPAAVHARVRETYGAIEAGTDAVDLKLEMPEVEYYLGDGLETTEDRGHIAWQIERLPSDPRGPEGCSAVEWNTWRRSRFALFLKASATNAIRSRRGIIGFWRRSPATLLNFIDDADERHFRGGLDRPGLGCVLLGETKPIMTPRETIVGFGAYLALGAALFGLMYAVAHVPAAKAALSVFIG